MKQMCTVTVVLCFYRDCGDEEKLTKMDTGVYMVQFEENECCSIICILFILNFCAGRQKAIGNSFITVQKAIGSSLLLYL